MTESRIFGELTYLMEVQLTKFAKGIPWKITRKESNKKDVWEYTVDIGKNNFKQMQFKGTPKGPDIQLYIHLPDEGWSRIYWYDESVGKFWIHLLGIPNELR